MEWVNDSPYFRYLKKLQENIDPISEIEFEFKIALQWAIMALQEQASVLDNIERVSNSDCCSQPPPKLTLIKGGKI